MKYGWIPSLPDKRNLKLKLSFAPLPTSIDLRDKCPDVYDQGQLGSCTGNAIAALYGFELLKQGKEYFMPSRLFIYYNERVIENSVNSDSGAMVKDGLKTLNKQGVCKETTCPYDINNFAVKPSQFAYNEALNNVVANYSQIQDGDLYSMKQSLAQGFPFVFGFTVFDGFESQEVYETGIVNMPTSDESTVGGHCVMAVGYNEVAGRFLVRNSWGKNWGMGGYFTIPYDYVKTMASDFWVINAI